jgi:hypothetical protein
MPRKTAKLIDPIWADGHVISEFFNRIQRLLSFGLYGRTVAVGHLPATHLLGSCPDERPVGESLRSFVKD